MADEWILRFSEPAAPSTWYYIGGTHGRTSSPSDTPANTVIPGNFSRLPTFSLSIFDGVEPSLNPRGILGAITLLDPTGVLDSFVTKVWDGGTLELRRGTLGADLSTFSTVASFTTAGILYDQDKKEIRVRDLGAFLGSAPLHDDRYGGTGGADGDAALKGVLKPYAVGANFNVTPLLIDTTNLIYQLSCTQIEQVEAVVDGGVGLTFSASDVANYAALVSASVSAGQYKTCLAEGLIKIGALPVYSLTCNFRGDKTGGTYVYKRGDIANRIVTRAGTKLSGGQVNSTSVTAVNTAQADVCTFYWDGEITKAQALTEVMSGCLGFWFVSMAGVLNIGVLDDPSGGTAAATYTWPDGCGYATNLEAYQVPRWKTIIGYQRNYTILGASQLAGSVAPVNVPIYGQEAQWEEVETASQKTNWPGAQAIKFLGGYYDQGGAAGEAARQQGILDTQIQRWRIPINEDPFTLAGYLGQVIAIASYPRYSWANPRKFVLVGVEWNGGPAWPVAILWG